MFGIPLPWLIIGVSIALFGSYRGGYHYGWADRDADMQAEISKKNSEAREVERNMTSKLLDKETELRKAQDEIVKKQSAMHELARTGKLRLPTASCVQASPSAAIASGNINQAPGQPDRAPDPDPSASGASEAERQTLQLIAQIAADGDKAINQLNACIDAYDNMRSIINGQR